MAARTVLRRVEPTVMLEQLGSSLYSTAMQLVVQDRTANASYPGLSPADSRQKAMTDFFMTNNLIVALVPVLPALLLARLSDRGWRKASIVVPLGGYLLSRLGLLLVLFCGLPLGVLFGSAALLGLSGGFCAFWAGVMTVTSLRTTPEERSKAMMIVEVLYGMTGVVGSLVSGHLFQLYTANLSHGTILLLSSTACNLLCLLHSIFLLKVCRGDGDEPEGESTPLLSPPPDEPSAAATVNVVNVLLLFVAAFLYDSSVGGAGEVLGSFELKAPLSWSAAQVGYGNAAGFLIFLTSFLGVVVLRRHISEVSMILIGMMSFGLGIYCMTFVTTTWMFYAARSLTLFGLIPVPTIRSLLSQQVPTSLYSTTLTLLQITFKVAALIYIPAFTKVYQSSLDWCPGFVFTLSSGVTVLAMVPVSVFGCRLSPWQRRHPTLTEH